MPAAIHADNSLVGTNLKSILKLEVPVSVQIASRTMPMRDVANLAPGAIIELPKLANEELEIVVSNRQIGVGTAVKVGENFGVRVNYIGDIKARIKAIAGASTADLGVDPMVNEDDLSSDTPTDETSPDIAPTTQADALAEKLEPDS